MKKRIKIFIDAGQAPHGWIHVQNFGQFSDLLTTVKIEEIETISFSNNLEDDDEDSVGAFSGTDCVVRLIQSANGKQLPQCFVHDDSTEIAESINHYVDSYSHTNRCIIHTIEEIA